MTHHHDPDPVMITDRERAHIRAAISATLAREVEHGGVILTLPEDGEPLTFQEILSLFERLR